MCKKNKKKQQQNLYNKNKRMKVRTIGKKPKAKIFLAKRIKTNAEHDAETTETDSEEYD